MKIDELNLSPRAYNCLRRAGIDTVEQLQSITASELKKVRGMGDKSLKEISEKLRAARYSEIDNIGIMQTELKRCPFCGGVAELVWFRDYGTGKHGVFATCTVCGVETPRTSKTSTEAREAWNRRVGDGLLERMVDDGK